jgi:hypothetical protein
MKFYTLKNKYNARKTRIDCITFASQKEAQYYSELKIRQKAGEVSFFLRQVPFDLPGGVRYFVDFVEFHSSGEVKFVDVKGQQTNIFKLKKKQVEDLYPITIELA